MISSKRGDTTTLEFVLSFVFILIIIALVATFLIAYFSKPLFKDETVLIMDTISTEYDKCSNYQISNCLCYVNYMDLPQEYVIELSPGKIKLSDSDEKDIINLELVVEERKVQSKYFAGLLYKAELDQSEVPFTYTLKKLETSKDLIKIEGFKISKEDKEKYLKLGQPNQPSSFLILKTKESPILITFKGLSSISKIRELENMLPYCNENKLNIIVSKPHLNINSLTLINFNNLAIPNSIAPISSSKSYNKFILNSDLNRDKIYSDNINSIIIFEVNYDVTEDSVEAKFLPNSINSKLFADNIASKLKEKNSKSELDNEATQFEDLEITEGIPAEDLVKIPIVKVVINDYIKENTKFNFTNTDEIKGILYEIKGALDATQSNQALDNTQKSLEIKGYELEITGTNNWVDIWNKLKITTEEGKLDLISVNPFMKDVSLKDGVYKSGTQDFILNTNKIILPLIEIKYVQIDPINKKFRLSNINEKVKFDDVLNIINIKTEAQKKAFQILNDLKEDAQGNLISVKSKGFYYYDSQAKIQKQYYLEPNKEYKYDETLYTPFK